MSYSAQPAAPERVRAMLEAMPYRGPDGVAHWCEGPVALGQALLHTTAESLHQPLPLHLPDQQLTLVLDGRLDNRRELQTQLRLATATPADAELVMAAYLKWGEDLPEHLEGDFALALWDAGNGRLLCARDHTGTRPFYYFSGDGCFAFATELPALLAAGGIELRPNQATVAQFAFQQWHCNHSTFWQGVQRLPAAHRMTVARAATGAGAGYGAGISKQPNPKCYWTPDFHHRIQYPSPEDYQHHYRELLTDVLRRQSRSHLPLALEVSGGLDSSANFAVAAALHRRQELQAPGLAGYTLDFSGCGDADEVSYARAVGEHCGLPVAAVPPTYQPLEWYRQRARTRREFAGAPNGVMAQGLFARAAAEGSRVIVNGTGGDEWLDAGYSYYAEALAQGHWSQALRLLQQDARWEGWPRALGALARSGLAPNLPAAIKPTLRQWLASRDLSRSDRQLLSPTLRRHLTQTAREAGSLPNLRHSWQSGLWHCLNNSYGILAHETMEVLAAEAGLEMRRPYWSKRLVQFSISLPRHVLSAPGADRPLHRAAMEGLLPAEVLARDNKAEFSCTFQNLTAEIAQSSLRCGADGAGELALNPRWFRPGALEPMLQALQTAPTGSADWRLWFLFCNAACIGRDN